MMIKEIEGGKGYMGGLSYGADLLDELSNICLVEGIELGRVEALGAVQKACIKYYDQKKKDYEEPITLEKPLEILNLSGNVSLCNEKPFVHTHITLSDRRGNTFGGHLDRGTIVFACEYIIHRIEGEVWERRFDEETGLRLWQDDLFTENDVKEFIYRWFSGFDHKKDKSFFKKHLEPKNINMHFPGNPIRSIEAFDKWHDENVRGKIRWNRHQLANVRVDGDENNGFSIGFDINWQAKYVDGGEVNTNFHQDWEVTVGEKRNFIITRHKSEEIDDNPIKQ